MATLVALLEVPAILVALVLARVILARDEATGQATMPASNAPATAARWSTLLSEVLVGRSIVLLAGGLLIGWASGPAGMARVEPFFVTPFEGVLTLFLLEMGLVTGRRLGDLRRVGAFLIGVGIVLPLAHGLLGVVLGPLVGLSLGGTTILAVLFASASYIAATAAVRLGLPEANPTLYLTASLAITFPFNLLVGIPLYARLTHAIWGGAS
jgi:uncharacterized protein